MNMFIENYEFIPNKKKTGEIINNLRKSKNMTYEELANELDVSPETVNKWIQGIAYPSIQTLSEIKKYFDISFQDLLLSNATCKINQFSKTKSYMEIINDEHFEIEYSNSKYQYNENDYPIIHNKQKIDYKSIFSEWKKNEIRFDFLLQKYFFSFTSTAEYIELCNYIRGTKDTDAFVIHVDSAPNRLKKIENYFYIKYGKSYKLNLSIDIKNAIIFDLQKSLNKYYDDPFEWLLLFNDFEYKKAYVDSLTPLKKDLLYNALIEASIDDFDDILDYLFSLGARKLNVSLNYSEYEQNRCNGVHPFIEPDPLLNYIHIEYEISSIFQDDFKRSQQIVRFNKAFKCLKYYLERMDYKEYLELRGGNHL